LKSTVLQDPEKTAGTIRSDVATLRRLVYHEEGNEIHRESEGPLAWKLFTNRIVEGMNLE
jgi:hypothetical protein